MRQKSFALLFGAHDIFPTCPPVPGHQRAQLAALSASSIDDFTGPPPSDDETLTNFRSGGEFLTRMAVVFRD